ncbi:MAG: CopG family transcriptional regulator [Candidatus Parabeggiatoa sp. nov. 3]|nr:MAG: CopG family transcriptional regulator [Gammaproteobacteria bacterium]RKZ68742.1 MAG: CopG family transcriptional regulator [Gammaproteobacteria bacterium]RKZ86801.1 MAG: CopG family transcriptional regulator [Gammaproteobacteria bacterium]
MNEAKVAITLDQSILDKLDELICRHLYPNRSRAIADAITEKLQRLEQSRLAQECAKLNHKEEKALAEEGISEEFAKWPSY